MALRGISVLEIAGLAPAPFAGMVLADHGAAVLRVDRAGGGAPPDVLARGKRSVALDLKHARGQRALRRLAARADVLIEPFRPGVMERLRLGPRELCGANPRLVYARLSGFGQTGPRAAAAGHDIGYLSLAGALGVSGPAGAPPAFPANLLGDFGGGGLVCALGVALALLERSRSGRGQVVDASIFDGSAYLTAFAKHSAGAFFAGARGTNLLDGGAHFYAAYECADGRHMSVGAIEPQFYARFVDALGLELPAEHEQMDVEQWPALKRAVAARFRTQPRAHWEAVFRDVDACVEPVLALDELGEHEHARARGTVLPNGEMAAAPRLDRTPAYSAGDAPRRGPLRGEHTVAALREAGLAPDEIDALLADGIAYQADAAQAKL